MAAVAEAPPAAEPVGPRALEDLKKGVTVCGDSGTSPMQLPPWLDLARCERVHLFFAEHAASLLFSWHCSLCIGFSLPSLLSALVFTGASGDPETSLKRYLRTAAHLVEWHLGNIWDPTHQAHSSIQSVRQLHASVRAVMTQTMPVGTWISSYDMACVQTGFMGAVTILPKKFGIHASDQDSEDYVYFWKCAGYQLGIADEFNLCSLGKDVADNIIWEIIEDVLLPDYAHPPSDYAPIAKVPRLNSWDKLRFFYLRLLPLLIGCLWPFRAAVNSVVLASVRRAGAAITREGGDGDDARCPFTGATFSSGAACPVSQLHDRASPAQEERHGLKSKLASAARFPLGLMLLLPAVLLLTFCFVVAVLCFVAVLPELTKLAPHVANRIAHALAHLLLPSWVL